MIQSVVNENELVKSVLNGDTEAFGELVSLYEKKIYSFALGMLSDPDDAYNREFMAAADILFLSDEGLWDTPETCLWRLAERYDTPLIALGRGSEGAMLFHREEQRIYSLPAAHVGQVVNTVGAGDALFSAFLHYYSKKFHPAEALLRAQLFAAAKIRCSGGAAGFVDEETVEELYRRHGDALKCWW